MQMTLSNKIAFGAMALCACIALSPAHAEDEAEAKPAAEDIPVVAAKQESFFYPLVRCQIVDGCNVQVMKPGASAWMDVEEGRYYLLGSAFRVAAAVEGAPLRAEFAFGAKCILKVTNAVEFATEPIEIGATERTVVMKRGRFSLDLPRTLPDGKFSVKAPFFACLSMAGESVFDYSANGDGDEVVIRCVTGSMALEGRHYKIERMGAANQIRIRTTGDDLFTSLRGESGDCHVLLDQGLVPEKNFETGEVKEVAKTLDFVLSPQCSIKIFRRNAAVAGRMIVSMNDAEGQHAVAEGVHLAVEAADQRRVEEDDGDLGDLGGLEGDARDSEPAARAVDLGPADEHEQEQRDGGCEDRAGEAAVEADREPGRHQHRGDTHEGEDDLPGEVIARVVVARRAVIGAREARGEHHHDADGEQQQRQQQERHVHGAPADRRVV